MRMRLWMIIIVSVLLPAFVVPAQGQLFRKSQPKIEAGTEVPQLLSIIRSDKDDRKRVAAIESLRNVDATAYPEIVPVLIEALLQDQRPNVRSEAAQTLGRIRPPSAAAAQALEQAAQRDSSRWVRLHSRTALVSYKLAGSSDKKAEPPSASQDKSSVKSPTPVGSVPPPRIVDKQPSTTSTAPKIIDRPVTPPGKIAVPSANAPRPLPNPAFSTAVPVPPATAAPPPKTSDGPVLAPPK